MLTGVNHTGNLESRALWKFDPVIRDASYYRRRWSFINGLFSFVFLVAGTVAFYFDNVTLPGRTGLAEFSGKWAHGVGVDRKSTRLNSSHVKISYAVFCLKKKKNENIDL